MAAALTARRHDVVVEVPADIADALAVGGRYEATLSVADRRAGSHFTPAELARVIVDEALRRWGTGAPLVCDPSCGGGVFLVLAAEALHRRGLSAELILDRCLIGFDVSAGAVEASRASLRAWAAARGGPERVESAVTRRDALDGEAWTRNGGPVDVVVGNPPFHGQLSSRTARDDAERDRLVAVFGEVARGYVDIAALFAVRAVRCVPDGGVVSLVLPRSIVAARDAAAARAELTEAASLVSLWGPPPGVFDAAVDVVVVLLERGSPTLAEDVVEVFAGSDRASAGTVRGGELATAATWSPLWATLVGLPELDLSAADGRPRVGDVARVTAGFRDQYYGVIGHVGDAPVGADPRRLLTTAMIDPGIARWDRIPVRVARQRRLAPWVDAAAVATESPGLCRWLEESARPKVLVATQTRVIEAVADPGGDFLALTPIISIHPGAPEVGDIGADGSPPAPGVDELAAAVSAPPAALWALRMFGGGGLSRDALKLAARQVARLPLPSDAAAWSRASALFGPTMDLRAFAATATSSWGLDRPDIVEWWAERARSRRAGTGGALRA